MRYCHHTTTSHSLSARFPQHLEGINSIILNETTAENLSNRSVEVLSIDELNNRYF